MSTLIVAASKISGEVSNFGIGIGSNLKRETHMEAYVGKNNACVNVDKCRQ